MGNLKGRRFKVLALYTYEIEAGLKTGDEGIILQNKSATPWVRMDKFNMSLNNAEGLCEEGHGWNLRLNQIELLPEEKVKQVFKMEEKDLNYLSEAIDTLPAKARGLLWKLLDQVVTD